MPRRVGSETNYKEQIHKITRHMLQSHQHASWAQNLLCNNPQCGNILLSSYQTICGCFLCVICVEMSTQQIHDSGNIKQPCPGATEFCPPEGISPDQIRRDRAKERDIQQLSLSCPNKCSPEPKLLCTLLDHLTDECPLRSVSCTQCSLQVPLPQLQSHEQEECEQMPKKCKDCGVILHWRQYEQHRDLRSGNVCCERLRSSCPFCGAFEEPSGFSRVSISHHWKQECVLCRRSCPLAAIHCCPQKDPPFVGCEEDLHQHVESSLNGHLVLMRDKSYLNDTQQSQAIEAGRTIPLSLCEEAKQIQSAQISLSTILDKIGERRLNQSIRSSASAVPRDSSPSEPSPPTVTPARQPLSVQVAGNEFVVKLFDYGAHRAAAQQSGMSDVGVETEPLYVQTSQDLPGYRLKLRIYFNGRGSGYNSHLSVYFLLVAGEWDDFLQWPFLHKISFALLRKWPPTPMQALANGSSSLGSVTLRPSPDSPVAQRPLPERPGEAAGQPLLIPFPLLERHFLLNDSFYLHVKVHEIASSGPP